MTQGEGRKRLASPVEKVLAGISAICWLVAIPFVFVDTIGPYAPSLRPGARYAEPVVAFALPLAVGSLAALTLRRPARSRAWRGFQVGMLGLATLALLVAVVRYAP